MSTPITTDAAIFESGDFCPGAGVLAVHIPEWKEDMIEAFRKGVGENVPCITSFGRHSPLLKVRPTSMAYAYIRIELAKLYEAWNNNMGRSDKMPIVSNAYMDKWFDRMGLDRHHVIAQLGVVQTEDRINLCCTQRGGHKLIIYTKEAEYGRAFSKRICNQDLSKKTVLLEILTDVAILTALAQFNRHIIHRQVCDASGFTKVRAEEYLLYTLTSGIDYRLWRILANEVSVGENELFLLPDGDSGTWMLCQASSAEESKPFPFFGNINGTDCQITVRNIFSALLSAQCDTKKEWHITE